MTRTHTRPVHTPADVARGLGAVLALVTFVVGVPAALVALAPIYLPEQIRSWGQLWGRIVAPDDGTLLLAVLAAVAWIAWAAFTTSVLVELVAAARRLRAPAVPLLGGFQRTAARLLAAAGLLLATTGTLTVTAAPAAASALVAPLNHTPPLSATPQAAPAALTVGGASAAPTPTPRTAALPTVTVQRGDTLWDIATRHLGDPLRYTQIRDLNLGHTQSDGGRLRDADWLQPGWTLLLPADATNADTPTTATSTAPAEEATLVVKPGDTLWDIAQTTLGDGARFPEIADLNHDITQPDGARLTDPDLIRPGWVLRLPSETTTAAQPASPAGAVASPQPSGPMTTPEAVAQPTTQPTASPADAAPVPLTAEPTPSPAATGNDAEAVANLDAEVHDARPTNTWFLGFAALGAVGIVGEIARRRHLQQRARKIGETIPLPEPASLTASAERTLRAAATPVSIEAIRTTLANVGCHCFDSGRQLPRVGALLLDEHHLTLLLVDDSPDAVAPFTAANPRTWVATTADVAAEQPIDDSEQCIPYPLLVVLGHTDDATLIVNLEAAGTLAVVGDDTTAEDALRALVLETATSDLATQLAVHVDEPLADLEGAFEDFRLRATDTRDDRTGTEADIAETLAETGHDDTLQLRGDRELSDLWLPYIYVEHTLRAAPSAPWSGVVTITRAAAETAWTIEVASDETAHLEPLGLDYQPQRLTEERLARLRDLLRISLPPESRRTPTEPTTAITDDIAAMQTAYTIDEPTSLSTPTASVNILGPITITGLPPGAKPLSPLMTELLVYLALHGPATGADLDDALWNGQRVDPQTRASLVYRTRLRTGEDILPTVGRWHPLRLGDNVATDWATFEQVVAEALAHDGQERIDGLTRALALVRDRPFRGIEGATYTWADYDIQRMTSAIADAAHLLARLQSDSGEPRRAMDTAMLGLAVEPFSETLQQLALSATEAAAGAEEAQRLRRRFAATMSRLDPELA